MSSQNFKILSSLMFVCFALFQEVYGGAEFKSNTFRKSQDKFSTAPDSDFTTGDEIRCALKCTSNKRCVVFSYNSKTRVCETRNGVISAKDIIIAGPEWITGYVPDFTFDEGKLKFTVDNCLQVAYLNIVFLKKGLEKVVEYLKKDLIKNSKRKVCAEVVVGSLKPN